MGLIEDSDLDFSDLIDPISGRDSSLGFSIFMGASARGFSAFSDDLDPSDVLTRSFILSVLNGASVLTASDLTGLSIFAAPSVLDGESDFESGSLILSRGIGAAALWDARNLAWNSSGRLHLEVEIICRCGKLDYI